MILGLIIGFSILIGQSVNDKKEEDATKIKNLEEKVIELENKDAK